MKILFIGVAFIVLSLPCVAQQCSSFKITLKPPTLVLMCTHTQATGSALLDARLININSMQITLTLYSFSNFQ